MHGFKYLASKILVFVAKKELCKTLIHELYVTVSSGGNKSTHRDIHLHSTTVGLHVICNINHITITDTYQQTLQHGPTTFHFLECTTC